MESNCKVITVYGVSDSDGEYHIGDPNWFFSDEERARVVARGRGWYGGDASVQTCFALRSEGDEIFVLSNPRPVRLDYGPNEAEAERQAALAKLTERERELLGVR